MEEQDPYFRTADPDNEHDSYREALERLEKKHRTKVAKVKQNWVIFKFNKFSLEISFAGDERMDRFGNALSGNDEERS